MIGTIAQHESAGLLRSPQIWVIAALLCGLFGFLFLQQLENYIAAQPQLALQDHPIGLSGFLAARFLYPLSMIFAVIAPLFAMRSFSDEFRLQTLALWQSSPVSMTALVIGKYLGILLVLLLLLLVAIAMPATMMIFVPIDSGTLLSSSLGLFLCTAACAATGLYFSSLTQQALIAVVASLGLLLLLWLLGTASLGNGLLKGLSSLSPATHLNGFFQGYLNSADVIYFVLFIVLFLALTVVRLDALRHYNH